MGIAAEELDAEEATEKLHHGELVLCQSTGRSNTVTTSIARVCQGLSFFVEKKYLIYLYV